MTEGEMVGCHQQLNEHESRMAFNSRMDGPPCASCIRKGTFGREPNVSSAKTLGIPRHTILLVETKGIEPSTLRLRT